VEQAPQPASGYAQSDDYDSSESGEDDVMLAVPPPSREHLAHIPQYVPSVRPHLPRVQSLGMRQTVIPILLTMGACMVVFGLAKFVVNEDSGYYYVPIYYPIAFLVIGFGLLGIAVVNMLQIRSMLASQAQPGPAN
jgi:hypothetical protein